MKRIRTVGLAVLTALALTAMLGAAAASASSKFTSVDGSYPVSLAGTVAGEFNLSTGPAQAVFCQLGSVTGTLSGASESLDGSLGSPKCSDFGSKPLNMNGCKFIFHSGSDNASFGLSKGTFDIGPAGCGRITFKSFSCGATTSYPAQTGLAASYENTGGNNVIIRLEASNLKYTRTGTCGAGSYTNGHLSGGGLWTLAGGEGKAVQVVQDSHAPEFEAESYPATISGAQSGTSAFDGGSGGRILQNECKKGTVASSLSAASTALSISPSYSECKFLGVNSTVTTNGCTYASHVDSKVESGKYSGLMDISCPAGKAIEIKMGNPASPACVATIGAQSGLSGMTYENDTSSGHRVRVVSNIAGIDFTLTKYSILCGINQEVGQTTSHTNGTYTGTVLTEGKDSEGVKTGLRVGS
ncbi:MAG: hypothetical protein WA862_09570 [Solirubrobacterales bacterium]